MPNPKTERNKKAMPYNPSIHDYTNHPPSWVEIKPNHFVLANEAEIASYRKEINS